MKKILIFVILACVFCAHKSAAQVIVIPEGYELVDSVVFVSVDRLDSNLVGKNIFNLLPSKSRGDGADVTVHQSATILSAMNSHFLSNSDKTISGYRVRIFFDNSQSARTNSESTLKNFSQKHPEVAAYRSYTNPYFKVTVGDFRTKSEAMELLQRVKGEFPSAFIVKENINFPVVDKGNTFRRDTLRLIRPVLPADPVIL